MTYPIVNNRYFVAVGPPGGGAGPWVRVGTIVQLSDVGDAVVVGGSTLDGSEKMRILGLLRVDGGVDVVGADGLNLSDPATQAAFLSMLSGDNAAVSASSEGRLRYSAANNRFEVSENGGPYVPLISGGGGPPFAQQAGATVSATTTSTTDVLAPAMSLTPPAGTYLATFSSSVSNDTPNQEIWASIYVDGAIVLESEREYTRGAAQAPVRSGFCCQSIVTVNGAQVIEGRWRVSNGTGTIFERTLTVVEVST